MSSTLTVFKTGSGLLEGLWLGLELRLLFLQHATATSYRPRSLTFLCRCSHNAATHILLSGGRDPPFSQPSHSSSLPSSLDIRREPILPAAKQTDIYRTVEARNYVYHGTSMHCAIARSAAGISYSWPKKSPCYRRELRWANISLP